MQEVELKLQVPAAAEASVERWVGGAGAERTRLQALYFDTPDRRLAAAGVALRLRREGRQWVQTLKAGPAHGLARGEHNVRLPARGAAPPALDPARHADSPSHAALQAALAGTDAALQPLYRTDVQRLHRPLRTRGGTVELAFDRGWIRATGPDGVERHWPLAELEIELLRGDAQAVVEVTTRAARRHRLWVDTRTKAERGDRLARGLGPTDPVAAVKAVPLRLSRRQSPAQAWAAVLDNVLAQLLPNWSEVAGGRAAAEPLHQLRVALRRLRSAERLFEGWPGIAPAHWRPDVAGMFRALGAARDRDVLVGTLQPTIDAAWQALVGPPAEAAGPAPAASVWTDAGPHDPGLTVLEVLAYGLAASTAASTVASVAAAAVAGDRAAVGAEGTPCDPSAPALTSLAAERLGRWHAAVRRDAKRFDALDEPGRHRLRRRLKRLRYAVEFCAGLWPRRAVERYLDGLRDAQERLGEYNDLGLAIAATQAQAERSPRAAFALGWLLARRTELLAQATTAMRGVRKAKPCWD